MDVVVIRTAHILVRRGLVLLLLTLFAVPCIACDDAAGSSGCNGEHGVAARCAGNGARLAYSDAPHENAPPCQCPSDAVKVRGDRPLPPLVIPVAILPPDFLPVLEPAITPAICCEPPLARPPLLEHPAVADRAPPTV